MKQVFENLGWHRDYRIGSKYVGFVHMNEPDREKHGYAGRQTFVLAEDVVVDRNGKPYTIKAGVQVTTECIPLCGRVLGTYAERIEIMKEHYQRLPYKRVAR